MKIIDAAYKISETTIYCVDYDNRKEKKSIKPIIKKSKQFNCIQCIKRGGLYFFKFIKKNDAILFAFDLKCQKNII